MQVAVRMRYPGSSCAAGLAVRHGVASGADLFRFPDMDGIACGERPRQEGRVAV